MENPPWVGCGADFRAALERGYQHVDLRGHRKESKQDQEEVRPTQRPGAVAAHAAIFDLAAGTSLVDCKGAHQASFPRLLTSRRMNIAATARIGTMNSETLAPSGISLLWIPTWKAQVANRCVVSSGPPEVRMRTMSKFANVTISENSVVIAMMFRIISNVTYQMRCHQLAPSIAAAS